MSAFLGNVCIAGVIAGLVTSASSMDLRPAQPSGRQDNSMATEVNRGLKSDRLHQSTQTVIVVKTVSIRPVSAPSEGAGSPQLLACEPLVSPLADPVVSRSSRECAA
jgi:hypothetical protein